MTSVPCRVTANIGMRAASSTCRPPAFENEDGVRVVVGTKRISSRVRTCSLIAAESATSAAADPATKEAAAKAAMLTRAVFIRRLNGFDETRRKPTLICSVDAKW